MKKYLLVGMTGVLALPLALFALDFRVGEWVGTGVAERAGEDLYLVGGSVTHAGGAGADLLAAGGNVLISGTIAADVGIVGGTVTIVSAVGDDLRAVGGTVILQSRVGGDALIAGGQVEVQGTGVSGDAVLMGGVVRIAAPVGGNLRVYGDEVFIDGVVGGNTVVEAEKVRLGANARLAGNFSYRAKHKVEITDGAVIAGATEFIPWKRGGQSIIFGSAFWSALPFFLAFLTASLVFGLFFRRYSAEAVRIATEEPARELGRGFLVALALPVASAILFASFVGSLLGVIGMLAAVAFAVSAAIFAPILVGGWLLKRVDWKSITLGALVWCATGLIPVVGWIAEIIVVLIALGVLARIKWDATKMWR
jgi:cytoskeletal protein CcmA (bactofilin family)